MTVSPPAFLNFFSSWVPVLMWAWGIYYLSGIPGLKTEFGIWDLLLRKMAHVIEFGILATLLIRAIRKTWAAMEMKKVFFWSGGVAVFYAVTDEIHQSFVPFRGPSIIDVMIDSIGVGLCFFIFKRLECKQNEQ